MVLIRNKTVSSERRIYHGEDSVRAIQEKGAVDGHKLSPVDFSLRQSIAVYLPHITWVNYSGHAYNINVVNSGFTAIVSSKWNQHRPYICSGPLVGNYLFSQIHFHWGEHDETGSEHSVDGIRYPLEMHVVHFKSDYMTQEKALSKDDGVAIMVHLFAVQEQRNPTLDQLTAVMQFIQPAHSSARLGQVPLAELVQPFDRNYYLYWGAVGSTLGLHRILWLVSRKVLPISSSQLAEFRQLCGVDGKPLRKNSSEPHTLGDRTLYLVSPTHQLDQTMHGAVPTQSHIQPNSSSALALHDAEYRSLSGIQGEPCNRRVCESRYHATTSRVTRVCDSLEQSCINLEYSRSDERTRCYYRSLKSSRSVFNIRDSKYRAVSVDGLSITSTQSEMNVNNRKLYVRDTDTSEEDACMILEVGSSPPPASGYLTMKQKRTSLLPLCDMSDSSELYSVDLETRMTDNEKLAFGYTKSPETNGVEVKRKQDGKRLFVMEEEKKVESMKTVKANNECLKGDEKEKQTKVTTTIKVKKVYRAEDGEEATKFYYKVMRVPVLKHARLRENETCDEDKALHEVNKLDIGYAYKVGSKICKEVEEKLQSQLHRYIKVEEQKPPEVQSQLHRYINVEEQKPPEVQDQLHRYMKVEEQKPPNLQYEVNDPIKRKELKAFHKTRVIYKTTDQRPHVCYKVFEALDAPNVTEVVKIPVGGDSRHRNKEKCSTSSSSSYGRGLTVDEYITVGGRVYRLAATERRPSALSVYRPVPGSEVSLAMPISFVIKQKTVDKKEVMSTAVSFSDRDIVDSGAKYYITSIKPKTSVKQSKSDVNIQSYTCITCKKCEQHVAQCVPKAAKLKVNKNTKVQHGLEGRGANEKGGSKEIEFYKSMEEVKTKESRKIESFINDNVLLPLEEFELKKEKVESFKKEEHKKDVYMMKEVVTGKRLEAKKADVVLETITRKETELTHAAVSHHRQDNATSVMDVREVVKHKINMPGTTLKPLDPSVYELRLKPEGRELSVKSCDGIKEAQDRHSRKTLPTQGVDLSSEADITGAIVHGNVVTRSGTVGNQGSDSDDEPGTMTMVEEVKVNPKVSFAKKIVDNNFKSTDSVNEYITAEMSGYRLKNINKETVGNVKETVTIDENILKKSMSMTKETKVMVEETQSTEDGIHRGTGAQSSGNKTPIYEIYCGNMGPVSQQSTRVVEKNRGESTVEEPVVQVISKKEPEIFIINRMPKDRLIILEALPVESGTLTAGHTPHHKAYNVFGTKSNSKFYFGNTDPQSVTTVDGISSKQTPNVGSKQEKSDRENVTVKDMTTYVHEHKEKIVKCKDDSQEDKTVTIHSQDSQEKIRKKQEYIEKVVNHEVTKKAEVETKQTDKTIDETVDDSVVIYVRQEKTKAQHIQPTITVDYTKIKDMTISDLDMQTVRVRELDPTLSQIMHEHRVLSKKSDGSFLKSSSSYMPEVDTSQGAVSDSMFRNPSVKTEVVWKNTVMRTDTSTEAVDDEGVYVSESGVKSGNKTTDMESAGGEMCCSEDNLHQDTDMFPWPKRKAEQYYGFQSPVRICPGHIPMRELPQLKFHGHWTCRGQAIMENTGTIIKLTLSSKTQVPRPYLEGGPLFDQYVFQELHFHWGKTDCNGAEHIFEYDIRCLEAHFLHYKKSYGSFPTALNHPDGLACVSVTFKTGGQVDDDFDDIIDGVKQVLQPHSSLLFPASAMFKWLKKHVERSHGYITYPGSLTMLPFNEAVTWIIIVDPFVFCCQQSGHFRRVLGRDGKPNSNFRKVQPLNNRPIYYVPL